MPFHLLACISSHGFGHFAMTAPILNELNKLENFKLTVRCELPEKLIRSRITGDFDIISESSDFGMVMNNSLDVDLKKTQKIYQDLHGNFSEVVELEKQKLLSYNADLILANIPYITIAAAKLAKIPVIAYCSLNWAEIFKSYFQGRFPEAVKIFHDMNDAYNSAECFICPAPSMAMPSLNNIKHVGPVASSATNVREKLNEILNIPNVTNTINETNATNAISESKLVLITPGGVLTQVPVDDWPAIPSLIWITAWPYKSTRKDIVSTDNIDLSFSDLLVSCDAVITKPGYGTVTETACNGVPALYLLRGDWAEEPFLERWWRENANVIKINRKEFFEGRVQDSLDKLWSFSASGSIKGRFNPVPASGITDILAIVKSYFK